MKADLLSLLFLALFMPLFTVATPDLGQDGEGQAAELLFVLEAKLGKYKSPTFLARFVLADDGRFTANIEDPDGDLEPVPWLRGRWLDLGKGKLELEPDDALVDAWIVGLLKAAYPGADVAGMIARARKIQIKTNGKGESKMDADWRKVYWTPNSDSPATAERVKLKSTEQVTA